MIETTFDYLVVGGGAVGCAIRCLWELTNLPIDNVLVTRYKDLF